ncbi:sugar porter family MFS transporter [Micromonospora sp. CPCC 206060]|uniref:sugar porter family MFS transporter n=1 Tax=Micromonospora sp. CPCC 206060 TaxID=3122406 RepID=UPI002FF2B1F5
MRRGSATGVAVTAALGGLLFGFDTGIISGALLYIRTDFRLGTTGQQLVVSVLLLGAIVGVVTAGQILDRLGRKKSLGVLAGVFTVAAVASALAPGVGTLMAARFALGLAVGASSVAVPVYVAEIAPTAVRGRLVSLYQFLVTVGILAAYLVGYALSDGGRWRWMLGLAAFPSLLMLLGVLRVPESPRWLLARGHTDQARAALARFHPAEEVDRELASLRKGTAEESRISYRDLFRPQLRRATTLGVAIAATNQLVGVNAVIYYAPTIFVQAGFGDSASLLSSVGIGTANVACTLAALLVIDRVGRRPLLLGGITLVVTSLIFLGALYLLPGRTGLTGTLLVVGLIAYIASFSASLGISIWLINSEVFPTAVRGKAASVGSFTHWALDFLVALTTLTLIELFTPTGLFWIFGAFGIVGYVFLYRRLPETKNRSLEEIEKDLSRSGAPGKGTNSRARSSD